MRLDFDFLLWVGSLVLSGVAVVLFLLLMREDRDASGLRREEEHEPQEAQGKAEGSTPNA